MKLTNKILLVFIILLFASFISFRLVLHSKTELVPKSYDRTFEQKTIGLQNFSSLEVHGSYYVHIEKADYDSLRIWGTDNLVNKYTTIENNVKILSIKSKIDLTKYFQPAVEIWIFTKKLESISVSNNALVLMESFTGNSFNFSAENSSTINGEDCNFINTIFNVKNKSMVSVDKIQNAVVDVRNSSSLILSTENGNVNGKTFDDSEVYLIGSVLKNTIVKDENKSRGVK